MKRKNIIHITIITICFFVGSVFAVPITAINLAENNDPSSAFKFKSQVASNDNSLLSEYFFWERNNDFFARRNINGILFSVRSQEMVIGQYLAELALSSHDIFDGTWQASVPFIPTNEWTISKAEVPVPAAVWLFGSGLVCLIGIAKRARTLRINTNQNYNF
jgi:hypothetical protein